jgi:hypothetical protein
VTKERRWAKIANKLGYPSGRSVGSILKNHYERILYPFDVFKQGKTLSDIVSCFNLCKSIYETIGSTGQLSEISSNLITMNYNKS